MRAVFHGKRGVEVAGHPFGPRMEHIKRGGEFRIGDISVKSSDEHVGLGGALGENDEFGDGEEDPLYEPARDTVVKAGKASASYLQRRLKIGYARAARLLDILEERGVIGPGEGAKPREILVRGTSAGEPTVEQ